MAKGAGSSRQKAPPRGQAEVLPPPDPPRGPDPVEGQPNVATRSAASTERRKDKVEYAPLDRDDDLSEERDEDYEEDELSLVAQEFNISEDDDEEDVIMDNLAPTGVGVAGGSKPPPTSDKVPWEQRLEKERQSKGCPHTTNAPKNTPSFMESLTNEQRQIHLALDGNKDAQMLYILNLGKELAKGDDGRWSMGRGLVQVNQLPTPPTYDGAYE
ncbi:unnamed protein product [Calypogeia fissa]